MVGEAGSPLRKQGEDVTLIRSDADYGGRGIEGGDIWTHLRIKGAKDNEDDKSFYIHDYRSKDMKILRKKLTDWYSDSKWGKLFINDFETICKKHDEFKLQIDRIMRR